MTARVPITGDDLDVAVTSVVTTLRAGVDRDWSVPAGSLEWSCRETVDHLCHCLISSSAQVEILLHGYDIASGLDLTLTPPSDVCERVLARMFPEHSDDLAQVDPWTGLLWATGRGDLPGMQHVQEWTWRTTPLTG